MGKFPVDHRRQFPADLAFEKPSSKRHLGRSECTDRDVVPVRISQRELGRSSARVHVRLLFEPSDERARPLQRQIEIINTEKQQKPVDTSL